MPRHVMPRHVTWGTLRHVIGASTHCAGDALSPHGAAAGRAGARKGESACNAGRPPGRWLRRSRICHLPLKLAQPSPARPRLARNRAHRGGVVLHKPPMALAIWRLVRHD